MRISSETRASIATLALLSRFLPSLAHSLTTITELLNLAVLSPDAMTAARREQLRLKMVAEKVYRTKRASDVYLGTTVWHAPFIFAVEQLNCGNKRDNIGSHYSLEV
jgi:hypothetical protein